MIKLIMLAGTLLVGTLFGYGQGTFIAYNGGPPTRVGSADGPLANSDYYGQFLVGTTPDALLPVGLPSPHYEGRIGAGTVAVPGIACREPAYIQMVAWDGVYWGTVLENVPPEQLGRTDIARVWLSGCYGLPVSAPAFTQPAIVPLIPEPSTTLLGLLGGGLLFAAWLVCGRGNHT